MSRATLRDVLVPALAQGYAVPVSSALAGRMRAPSLRQRRKKKRAVILQAGPGCRAHTPLPVQGAMFRHLADEASVPVVLHLDHATTIEECKAALDQGFTSIRSMGRACRFTRTSP